MRQNKRIHWCVVYIQRRQDTCEDTEMATRSLVRRQQHADVLTLLARDLYGNFMASASPGHLPTPAQIDLPHLWGGAAGR